MCLNDVARYKTHINRFWYKFWQRCCRESVLSNVICYLTPPNECLWTTWENMNSRNCVFSVMLLYRVSKTTLLWLAISSTLVIWVCAVHFHPGSTKKNSVKPSLQTATDTISDEENVGRQRSKRSGIRSDVAQVRIARRVDTIVLQVDWRRYSEHFFVREEDEVDSMFREHLNLCRFRHTLYSTTEKTQFLGFTFPRAGNAATLVTTGRITNHHLIA